MFFLIGLGNPGSEYEQTRHNVGWLFLDFLQKRKQLPDFSLQKKWKAETSKDNELVLVKPQTYMNDSGEATQAVLHFFKEEGKRNKEKDSDHSALIIDHLFVIHDDLDIPFGSFKVQLGTGPKVHNGVNSIRQHLGTDQFWYVRLGVDGRQGVRTMSGRNYVLQSFSAQEKEQLQTIFAQVQERINSRMMELS